MWTRYRAWKHALIVPLAILAAALMKRNAELSPLWFAGLVVGGALLVAYVVEEIVWMSKGQGRPCGHCGKMVRMKSFTLHTQCPHCGLPLE